MLLLLALVVLCAGKDTSKEIFSKIPPPAAENECFDDSRYATNKVACTLFTGVDVEPNYSFCGYNYKNYTKAQIDAVKKVHVIFMTHFDLGYTDFQYCVVNRYLSVIFDEVMDTAEAVPTFIYTTEPWIAYVYLNCDRMKPLFKPPHPIEVICPTEQQVQRFVHFVNTGQIVWHAFPWHGFNDMMDTSLYEFGFDFAIALSSDPRFNMTKEHIVMAQVDVPGMGVAAVPTMQKKGVKAVYIGSNEGIGFVPDVQRLFRWLPPGAPDNDTGVLMMLHALGYGGLTTQDAFINPYTNEALLVACCIDNTHGYSPPIVEDRLLLAASNFPNADVFPSTFDAFAKNLVPHALKFPAMRSNIGDMWNRAATSDPRKTAMFRVAQRERTKCIQSKKCPDGATNLDMLDFSQFIQLSAEHNWGISPNNTWDKSTASWIEKRECLSSGLDALKRNGSRYKDLVENIESEWAKILPKKPDLTNMTKVTNPTETTLQCSHWELKVGDHGQLVYLKDSSTGHVWSDPTHPIGWMTYYEYLNQGNYINKTTLQDLPTLAAVYFSKEMCKLSIAVDFRQSVETEENDIYEHVDSEAPVSPFTMWAEYGFPISKSKSKKQVVHDESFTNNEEIRSHHKYITSTCIALTTKIFNKHINSPQFGQGQTYSANIGFRPLLVNPNTWELDIMSSMLPAVDTVKCGTQHYHNVWDGVHNRKLTDASGGYFTVLTTDTPLMSIGYAGNNMFWNYTGAATPFDQPPIYTDGISYNLFNTMNFNWVSFYPYTEEDTAMQWRFQLCVN